MATNRNKNPNEYVITNVLGNRTRVRHSQIMQSLLNALVSTDNLYKLDANGDREQHPVPRWIWGQLGTRIGSSRSADGMIYSLPIKGQGNNNAVAKFIFSLNDTPKTEIKISKMMGAAGIGPKIFACYSADISDTAVMFFANYKKLVMKNPQLGGPFVNLFQAFKTYPLSRIKINHVFILVMENLYNNPVRHVINGFTVTDIRIRKPGTAGVKIPVRMIQQKYDKMHQMGIAHGDMHGGNVVVQELKPRSNHSRRFSVRIIDFGRSIDAGHPINNANSNQVINAQVVKNHSGRYKNSDMIRTLTQRYRGAAAQGQPPTLIATDKLASGYITLLKSGKKREKLSAQKAVQLQNNYLKNVALKKANYIKKRNNARAFAASIGRRGSLTGKYEQLANAQFYGAAVGTLEKRQASNLARKAVGKNKIIATLARRVAAFRQNYPNPTQSITNLANLELGKREKNIQKETLASLQRRGANLLKRNPVYFKGYNNLHRKAAQQKGASLQRRHLNGAVSMDID